MSPFPIVTATSFTYATAVTSPSLVPSQRYRRMLLLPHHRRLILLSRHRRFSPSPPCIAGASPHAHLTNACCLRHLTMSHASVTSPALVSILLCLTSPSRHRCLSPSSPHLRLTSPSRQHRSSPFLLAGACGHCYVSDVRYRRHVTNACSHPHNTDDHRKCHVTKI